MRWQDRATLYQADYRVTLGHAAAAGGADLVLTSPPYCDARTYGSAVNWTDADYAALGDAVFAALRPGGHALINVDAPVRGWRPGFGTERGFHPWRLMLDWAERVGFRVPDRLAFGRMGLPGQYAGRFRNDWEPLLWFQRPGADGWMDKKSIAAPANKPRGRLFKESVGRRRNGAMVSEWTTPYDSIQQGTLWTPGYAGHGLTGAPDIEAANHPPPAGRTNSPRTSCAASVRRTGSRRIASWAQAQAPSLRLSMAAASLVGTFFAGKTTASRGSMLLQRSSTRASHRPECSVQWQRRYDATAGSADGPAHARSV